MRRRTVRGLSIVEILVASTCLAFLFSMTFIIFKSGAQTWLKSDSEAELLGKIHAVVGKIGRQAERSYALSLSVADSDLDPNLHGCAFLSTSDPEDRLQFDPYLGQPRWTDARVYYFDSSTRQVFTRVYPLSGVPQAERLKDYSQRFTKPAVDSTLNPSPRNALSDRMNGGQVLAQDIRDLRFEKVERDIDLSNGSTVPRYYEQLAVSVTVEKESYAVSGPLQLSAKSYFLIRN